MQSLSLSMSSSDHQLSDYDKGSKSEQEISGAEISLPSADPAAVKRLLRKCDLHVVPPLFMIFLMAFLDRTNIGNARIQGLEASLGMKGSDYNIALFIFFIPYILLEVPSNIIIKRVAPSTWLSGIMVFWGKQDSNRIDRTPLIAYRYCDNWPGLGEKFCWVGCLSISCWYFRSRPLSR